MGANYKQLPVNRPKTKVMKYQRDRFIRLKSDFERSPNYSHNTFRGPEPDSVFKWPNLTISGLGSHHPYGHSNSGFVQPRTLYKKVMTDVDRDHLIGNIVDHLGGAKKEIQLRQNALFYKVHEEYSTRVAEGLGLEVEEVKRLAQE